MLPVIKRWALVLMLMPMSVWATDLRLDDGLLGTSAGVGAEEAVMTPNNSQTMPARESSSAAVNGNTDTSLPVRMLMDVRSVHSDGAHTYATLAELAKARGIEVLAFGEHDRFTIRLGLDPIPQWIGYSQEHPSIYTTGLAELFGDLDYTRKKFPDMKLMLATESTPGYHWTGIPFRDLTLHNAERHIIALGVERPAQIQALPSFSLIYGVGNQQLSLIIWCVVVFALLIILFRRRRRGVALLLLASFIAFLSTWLIRDRTDPDEAFLQAAHEQGLFTVWAHPGTMSGVRDGPMGVKLDTPPYSRRVFEQPTADGFAAIYGDTDYNCEPGGPWDRLMQDYVNGYIQHPIWAVSAGDFHKEGDFGVHVGDFPMDVFARSTSHDDIMWALERGHVVAWGVGQNRNPRMRELKLVDANGKTLLPGDEEHVRGTVTLYAAVDELVDSPEAAMSLPFTAQWIVDGEVVSAAVLPVNGEVSQLSLNLQPGPHVVRLRIPSQQKVRMEANPFLLHVDR